MVGHECYHCKQWVAEGEAHDCWTTTESALTRDLSNDLQEAYERLRETAVEFGEQRIYASHNSIMFARKACYFFVRPKRSFLEVCIFLPRTVRAPQVRRTTATSKVKVAHLLQIRHRDEVEAPITDWLLEAYKLQDAMRSGGIRVAAAPRPIPTAATAPRIKTRTASAAAARRRAKKTATRSHRAPKSVGGKAKARHRR
jgi:hypothetical protein